MQRGEWTHNGSAAGLRRLAVQQKAIGERGLINKTRRELNKAAQPAREAVPAMERAVLPKSGGLNEWVASTPVRISMLTGAKTAGVMLRQSRKGSPRPHDLRRMNDQGLVRHPTRTGRHFSQEDRDIWRTTDIPSGFWENALIPVKVKVTAAMLGVLHEAGYEAGFR